MTDVTALQSCGSLRQHDLTLSGKRLETQVPIKQVKQVFTSLLLLHNGITKFVSPTRILCWLYSNLQHLSRGVYNYHYYKRTNFSHIFTITTTRQEGFQGKWGATRSHVQTTNCKCADSQAPHQMGPLQVRAVRACSASWWRNTLHLQLSFAFYCFYFPISSGENYLRQRVANSRLWTCLFADPEFFAVPSNLAHISLW